MFSNFRPRKKTSQMAEHQAFERSPVVSHFEDKLVNRRGILSAGLAFSASGWIAGNSSAGAEEGLPPDAAPADVLAYLYAGNARFAKRRR